VFRSKHLLRKNYRGCWRFSFLVGLAFFALFWMGEVFSSELLDYLRASGIPCLRATLVGRFPHDSRAFTQGLLFSEGVLYESTGLYGKSTLRRVDPETGEVLDMVSLDKELFGEGLALRDGELVQLTWRERTVLFWDTEALRFKKRLPYPFEGWGLTFDGSNFIASDGSSLLRFLSSEDLSLKREVAVTAGGREIDRINELEYAEGKIYANLWYEDLVLVVDPGSGNVVGWLDFSFLRQELTGEAGVMNGIAFDPKSGNFYLTGKNWPFLYVVKIED